MIIFIISTSKVIYQSIIKSKVQPFGIPLLIETDKLSIMFYIESEDDHIKYQISSAKCYIINVT